MIATVRSLLAEGRALVGDFARFGGRRLGAAIVLMLVGGILEGIGLAMLVPIFSLLEPQAGGRWRTLVTGALSLIGLVTRIQQLAAVLAAFCVLIGVRAVVLAMRDRLLSDLSLGFVDHRRLMVVHRLAHARWSSLARLRHARIAHILSSEIARIAMACALMMQIATSGIMLLVQAVLIVILSPAMAALMIVLAAAALALLLPLSRRAADTGKSTSRFAFRIVGEAAQFLGGLKIAVAHGMADSFVDRIGEESARLRVEQDAQRRFQSHIGIASTSISSLIGAAIILAATMAGVSTVTLIAALVVLVRMSGPLRMLQLSVQQLFGVLPAFTALRDLQADLEPAPSPAAMGTATNAAAAPEGAIRFERVAFRYPDASTPVFTALDLVIAPGETVGLAGPSGTGKTTFVDLLTGLLEPDAGRITIGDVVLTPAALPGWRRRLAYVAQDSYLINDSIRHNLGWGGAARPEVDLWRALAQAGAADMVAAMPEGLDTMMDERGGRLSGGERQRIALARALLRDPALLILDEATNAIDVATEQEVIANIRRALPQATMLVIAHRDETLRACDRIVALAGMGAGAGAGEQVGIAGRPGA